MGEAFDLRTFKERLEQKMLQRGMKPNALSKAVAGGNRDYIRILLERGSRPNAERLAQIARALRCSIPWLIGETDVDEDVDHIPFAPKPEVVWIVGSVQAGAFRDEFEEKPSEHDPFVLYPDLRFQGAQRFALRVVGRSMDKIAPPGAILFCVPFAEIGRGPRRGEVIIVRRWEHDRVEATCKRYAEREGQPWAEPCSNDESYEAIPLRRKPLTPEEMETAGDVAEPYALVIASYVQH